MAKVFLNKEISGNGKVWFAKNGATRRELVVILNDKDFEPVDNVKELDNVSIRWLDKGNHSFIFINKAKKESNNIVGIFLNETYSYDCLNDKELYSNSSVGGYGNSESKFGVYKLGAIIKEYTYKYRKPASYWYLSKKGWLYLGTQVDILSNLSDYYNEKVANELGWLDELKCDNKENCIE